MLPRSSLLILGTVLATGVAAAAPFSVQPSPTFPTSISESGPNYPAPTTRAAGSLSGPTGASGAVQTPSSVSESMPEMTGGQSHPTMGSGAARDARTPRNVGAPSSVSENMPEMTGGQSHPTMRH